MIEFSPEKALIFRITHIDNVPWILINGLHCRNSKKRDPNYREIGNPDLISKRAHRVVPISPGGTLSDYIPFYFTPYSPMLLNIKTGYNGVQQRPMQEIVILVAYFRKLADSGVTAIFTDRHAYLAAAEFSADLGRLVRIDWKILRNRDFRRDSNNFEKVERYQAEALVHRHLPVAALAGIVCYGKAQGALLDAMLQDAGVKLKLVVNPDWYF
jgi:hypothetical protein